MAKRLYFVDWLRVLAVLLLFPFHTARVFNAGEAFYVKAPVQTSAVNAFLGFVDVWHMPLLFALAGASTYLALGSRSGGQYVGERLRRLLVPLLFGFLLLIPPQTWYGGRFNSGYLDSFWHYMSTGDFLVFNIRDGGDYFGGFGIGHLWFVMFLLLISLLALPLVTWARFGPGDKFMRGFSRRLGRPQWWLLAAFVILIGEAFPEVAGKNLFYYASFFVLGFAAMFDESFVEAADRNRWAALGIGVVLSAGWLLTGPLRDSLPDPSVPLVALVLLGSIGKWAMIVGLLGMTRHYLDRPSSSLSYLAEGSYPLYILHQTVIVVIAFYLVQVPVTWPVQIIALLAVSVGATFALYEVVRRVNPARVLFGMKARPVARVEGTAPAGS